MIAVLLRRFAEFEYIIDVTEGRLPVHDVQNSVHGVLGNAGCGVESKRHMDDARKSISQSSSNNFIYSS